jgi:hypothetical protein
MQRDDEGVWSVRLTDGMMETFKYCFVVDGTRVADPSNMYLSPDRGFKYSVASNPASPYNWASMGDIRHGRVSYDLNRHEACYAAPVEGQPRHEVVLVAGKDDTVESWFKVGGADAMADRLASEGLLKPCIIRSLAAENGGLGLDDGGKVKKHILRAADYTTWPERRKALERLLKGLE